MRVNFRAKMPAKDIYHNAVKSALVKDGWRITADPYRILYEDAELYADLAAERPIAAQRDGQKIVVEIKSFVGRSLMYDFHSALGQYMVYRRFIELTEPVYQLYLAIDDIAILIVMRHSNNNGQTSYEYLTELPEALRW